jgi:hypothetical protein
MTLAEIEERLILNRAAIMGAIQSNDMQMLAQLKAEAYGLNMLLAKLTPARAANHAARLRGRKPVKRREIEAKMRDDVAQGVELQIRSEKQLVDQYGGSRDTCRKARDAVLASVEK